MKTMTFTLDPSEVPTGSIVRVYHRDSSAYVGEAVSDGSGTVAIEVSDEWLAQMTVRVLVAGVDGERDPRALRVMIG